MEFVGWLVAVVLGGVAFAIARSALNRAEKTEAEVQYLHRVMENLAHSVAELKKQGVAPAATAAAPSQTQTPPQPQPVTPPAPKPETKPEPAVAAATVSAPRPPSPPPVPAAPPVSPLTPPTAPLGAPVAASTSTPPPAPQSAAPVPPPPPKATVPPPQAAPAGAQPPPRPPTPPPVTPPSGSRKPAESWFNFDWEGIIGVKLFAAIAAIAVVLATILALKIAADKGVFRPPIRAAMGTLTGIAIIFVCELRIARTYKVTANAMHGAGIAMLYATLFAAYARWHLVPALVAFGAMVVVTIVAVLLSIRRESVFIALLGLFGGFATPAMLSTGENRPIGLFTYLLVLNVALAWVAMKRRWTVLTGISLVFTAIYQWGWIAKFLTASQVPLAAAIFLVFAIMAAISLWMGRRDDEAQPAFDVMGVAGAVLPLLFAVFVAAVPAYGAHYHILFGFLILLCAGLAVIAIARGPLWLHLLGGVVTLLVFAVWRATSFQPSAWPVFLAWIAAFFILYLGIAFYVARGVLSGPPSGVSAFRNAVFTAPLLLFLFPTFVSGGNYAAKPWLLFGVLFLLLSAGAAYAVKFEEGLVYYVGTFAALATEAFWSGTYLSKERLISGLMLYGIFALFYLGVPVLARRFQKRLDPQGAFTVLVLLSIAMLFFLDGDRIAEASLWGLTLLLAILNAGALLHARSTRFPILSVIAAILSWLVIAVWWSAVTITAAILPALIVVAIFGVLIVAGNVWARAGTAGTAPAFEGSTYLALAGHLFLLFAAGQPALAFPPWPIFGVLFVLQLALGVAALWLRREKLMTAACAASQIVLVVWAMSARGAPWPNTALLATVVVAALALAWYAIDRRFAESALVALFAGQFVAICAGVAARPPLFGTLLATHLGILAALFVVAWLTEQHFVLTMAAVTSTIAIATSQTNTPRHLLIFAAAIYALFLVYPLLLGKGAKHSLHPYLAPILASATFFGFAYDALVDLGYKPYIGALPVVQAVLLLVLLLRLLQIEQDVARLLSRLALVAAAALAFITLAIPLQLDKEWITLAWALEGAALIWLYHRIPHRGLVLWGGALLAVVFVRLTLNPAVLSYHPPQSTAIINWYLYTYLVGAATMFAGGSFLTAAHKRYAPFLHAAGTILLFFLVNIEIADYFSTGSTLTFNFLSSSLKQDLWYTLGWASFAIGMLIAGIRLGTRAARVAAILLLVVTVLKCFLHDLARFGGLYRVFSLLGLAASLLIVTLLLQKYVLRRREVQPETAPETPVA